jgi:hypothetical protein
VAIIIDGKDFVISKGIVRTLSLRNDIVDSVGDPEILLDSIRKMRLPVDLLEFPQSLDDPSPGFPYPMELDNLAAVKISTYEEWLKQIHTNTRKKIKKAQKCGVVVKTENLSRQLVQGMADIFNETAVRRGRRYSYFGRDLDTVEKEWSADAGRNIFLVAYYQDDIIGFFQLSFSDHVARASGTIAKLAHRDKAPMNALVAKSVEVCVDRNIRYLVYGKYAYGKKGEDSLTEFKRNNGFQRIERPMYYVPLSFRGRIGLLLGLHHGLSERMPVRLYNTLSKLRSLWYERLDGKPSPDHSENPSRPESPGQ